jgi:hypothetical protein
MQFEKAFAPASDNSVPEQYSVLRGRWSNMSGTALDAEKFEEPAKAIVRREWRKAAGLLVQVAAAAATGNPFVGIVAGGAAEWLWITVAAQSVTQKLKRAEADLEKLDEAQRVAFVQKCLQESFADVREEDAPLDSVRQDVELLAGLLEEGLTQTLLQLARQGEKIDAISKAVVPSPGRTLDHLESVTKRWLEEIDSSVAGVVSLPRTELRASLLVALKSSPVAAVLGESGVGKSALVKVLLLGLDAAYAVHAQDLQALLDRVDYQALREMLISEGTTATLVVDGVEHLNSAEKLRSLGTLIRLLYPANGTSRWRLVITCRASAWESVVRELGSPNELLDAAETRVPMLTQAELEVFSQPFPDLARVVDTAPSNWPLRKLKLLDLAARQKTRRQVAFRITESEAQLADWYWTNSILAASDGVRRGEIVKQLARRRQENGSYRAPLSVIPASERGLLASLQDEGVLRMRDETIALAHDWLETVGLQRLVMEAYGTGDTAQLIAEAAQPGWHASLQLAALHCLESSGRARWLEILVQLHGAVGGDVASDLWFDAAFQSPEIEAVLSDAQSLLLANDCRLLERTIRRAKYRHSTLHPAIARAAEDIGSTVRSQLERDARYRVPIPGAFWTAILCWLSHQTCACLTLIHGGLLDLIEIALNHRHYGIIIKIPDELSDYLLATIEIYVVARARQNGMVVPSGQDYRVLLDIQTRLEPRAIASKRS